MTDGIGKAEGFRDETYLIVPTESFTEYMAHPLIRAAYLTDVGFFPRARKGIIEVEGRKYHLGRSDAFCIPRHKRHRYYADEKEPWSILWVHFKGESISYYPVQECRVIHLSSRASDNRMMVLFKLLFRVLERNYTLGNFIYISQVLALILSEIYFREKMDESTTSDRHVTQVVRYMYQNLNKNLTLSDISREVELSKSYLNAIFKAQTGKSPVEFFIHLKMQEACKLLKSGQMYVYEAAAALGYEDQYYFSRIFKKVVGVSPRDYQNGDYFYPE